jgi:crotonobetainyl-CoA:carnitine CoA-transferase CaiB-like acyl-CoA transferase
MYTNILDLSFEALVHKVEQESERRKNFILQSMTKIDGADKKASTKLNESEKAILKALGLSIKDIKALKEQL